MSNLESRIRILVHNAILFSKYRPWGKIVNPMIVYMIDGSMHHSGLVDRLKQIMGVYARCKHSGYKFKLIANYPFELSNYLLPNYNWKVNDYDFSQNIFYARPLYLGFQSKDRYKSLLTLKNRQLHVYAHCYWDILEELGYSMKQIFWELFDPIPEIKEFVQEYKERYNSWDCLHFRFQNLLGDFNEPLHYKKIILNDKEKDNLRNKCFQYVFEESKKTPNHLLVCSDSISFLQKVSEIPGVLIIPGMPTHMDYIRQNDFELHLKSFLDFFMIAESESVRNICASNMYPSSFPELAASINDLHFERVNL